MDLCLLFSLSQDPLSLEAKPSSRMKLGSHGNRGLPTSIDV